MSIVDYTQTVEDHQGLLVLVQHTGNLLSHSAFNKTWERIRRSTCVSIPRQKRSAWVRYKRRYLKECNEWGDFQAHRKTLGLISVGECSNLEEFELLFDCYKKNKEEYANSLFNSRLIVFGMNRDGSPLTEEQRERLRPKKVNETDSAPPRNGKSSPVHSEDSGVTPDLSPTDNNVESDLEKMTSQSTSTSTKLSEPLDVKNSLRGEKQEDKKVESLKSDDSEKTSSNESLSRPHSNSLKESTGSEVVFYPSIEDCGDLEERVQEFVTSLFFVLEGKRLDRSFERADRMQLLCTPFEKKDYVGLDTETKSFRKKCQGRLRKHLADLCLQAGIPGEAILHYQTAIDILRPVNDWLWIGACYEGICSASVIVKYPKTQAPTLRRNYSMSAKRGSSMSSDQKLRAGSIKNNLSNGLQEAGDIEPKSVLGPDDIVEKYREALVHYSKFKNAAVIEMEASLKACRFLALQRKYLQASDFLQNVVYINLQVSDEDRITRYCTLSQLYSQIGFLRKAAFFKRIAAMQCVAPNNPHQNWALCHTLLMQCLDGYKICVDPKERPADCMYGWPVLQSRVLNELIYSAKRTSNFQLAIRHTTLLLRMLDKHLHPQERKEVLATLQGLTAKCEGGTQTIALDNGTLLPPVPLNNIPYVKSFKLMPLQPRLEPVKMKREAESTRGPFIFTPLQLGQSDTENKSHVDFLWVARDVCEVQLQVYNSLPEELSIQHMSLLTEGVDIEAYPMSPSIPAQSGPCLLKILSRPRSPGDLHILGYYTNLLGVKSNCRLRDLPELQDCLTRVTVIPPLPQIQLTSSLPKADTFTTVGDTAIAVTSGTAALFAGESKECMVTIQNTSNQAVDWVNISLDCKNEEKDFLSKVFQWSKENIDSQLPLQPNGIICFTLCIHGYSDFLPAKTSRSGSHTSSRSQSSSHSSQDQDTRCVESLLKVEYSGGAGLEAGYCRRCAIAFSIDIIPSVIFQNWDVLPSESFDHCYLVFDMYNVSSQELQLQYGADQTLTLPHRHTQRLTVQIEKYDFPPEPEKCKNKRPVKMIEEINHYSACMSESVHIHWSGSSSKSSGQIRIDHLKWEQHQLELMKVSDIAWNVYINKQRCTLYCLPVVCVGNVVDVEIDVTFRNDTTFTSAMICTECSELYEQSDRKASTNQLAVIGSSSYRIDPAQGLFHKHRLSYMFFFTGTYKLNVKCVSIPTTDNHSNDLVWKCHEIQIKVIEEAD